MKQKLCQELGLTMASSPSNRPVHKRLVREAIQIQVLEYTGHYARKTQLSELERTNTNHFSKQGTTVTLLLVA